MDSNAIMILAAVGVLAAIALVAWAVPKLARKAENEVPKILGEATLASYHADLAMISNLKLKAAQAQADYDSAMTNLAALEAQLSPVAKSVIS